MRHPNESGTPGNGRVFSCPVELDALPGVSHRSRKATVKRSRASFFLVRECLIRVILLFIVVQGLSVALPSVVSAQSGLATYYTAASCRQEGNSGVYTASGERYDESAFTVALPRRTFGNNYRITNPSTGKTIIVRHNDFGPGRRPRRRGVIADLTPAAYDALGCPRGVTRRGVAWGECQVMLEPL